MQKEELKKTLLDLLLEDKEFRHAVAGAIGYKEILDRIAKLEEDMNKRFLDMEERFNARFLKVEEEIRELRKDLNDLRRDMQEGFKRMDKRLSYIESFMDNISVSIEDEARDMVAYLLKQKGITLNITDLTLPDLEIDIYAVDTDYCIVGEAKTRAVRKAILQVEKDIARLCKKYPSYTRGKVIKVVYAIRAMPDAVEEARSRGIWLVTARGELTELKI
ncbi:MAG: hypothetical protein QXO37_07390 [Candidatus Nitrosocaldaceae archaeon]